jgi:hypothetical protein
MKMQKEREKREGQQRRSGGELMSMPSVNALSFTVRYLPGGRNRFLEFVKLAAMNGDANAGAWWAVFADLPKTQRNKVNFDDVCGASGVKPSALLSAVVGHGMEASVDMANLVAAALHPEVVAAAGKSALRISGPHAATAAEDRKNLLQARGFLPVPKGASIHVHASASSNAQAAAAAHADPSVPSFSADIAALSSPRSAVQRRLAEPAEEMPFGPIVEAVQDMVEG